MGKYPKKILKKPTLLYLPFIKNHCTSVQNLFVFQAAVSVFCTKIMTVMKLFPKASSKS